MTDRDDETDVPTGERDADDWSESIEVDPESLDFEGDPEEAIEHVEERIGELEDALAQLDVLDPQRGLINLELGTLRATREALREKEGDS